MKWNMEYYKLLALEQARVLCSLFTSICFHTRLDTLSVNSRIYRSQLPAFIRNVKSAVVELITFVEFIYFIHVLTSQEVCINISGIRRVG